MADELVIKVNGKPHTVQAAPETRALGLRNELGLHGPQFGCGLEQCGACMVLVGSEAKNSCKLKVSEVGQAPITTVEGLSEAGELHPVQRAFLDEEAAQCGYWVDSHDHPHHRPPAAEPGTERHEDPRGAGREPLPLRNACAHLAGGETSGGIDVGRSRGMMTKPPRGASGPQERNRGAASGSGRAEAFMGQLTNRLDDWLRFQPDGTILAFSGKVDLGTGARTALAQIVAEELDVPFAQVLMGWGYGPHPQRRLHRRKHDHPDQRSCARRAAAEARLALLEMASDRLDAAVEELEVRTAQLWWRPPRPEATYTDLIGGKRFDREVTGKAPVKRPEAYRLVGTSVPRVDIPQIVAGQHVFIQDVVVPGMLHGRLVRPPSPGASLVSIDDTSVRDLPGLVKVVREGNFVGVVAEREKQAILAAERLAVSWEKERPAKQREPVRPLARAADPEYRPAGHGRYRGQAQAGGASPACRL